MVLANKTVQENTDKQTQYKSEKVTTDGKQRHEQQYATTKLTLICARTAIIMYDGHRVAQTLRETPRSTTIRKSRGFVNAYDNRLYRQVEKHGDVRHQICCVDFCDGSAKLENGQFKLIVSLHKI